MFVGPRFLALSTVAVAAVCVLAGCTVKSTKRVTGSTSTLSEEWQAGDRIDVYSVNGRLGISQGSGDQVRVEVTPFVLIAYDATDAEEREELEKLNATIERNSDDGAITIETRRMGNVLSSLGADVDVELPPDFDGTLRVAQKNGPIEINSVAQASDLRVDSENGSCEIVTGTARWVDVYCDFGGLSGSIPRVPDDLVSASLRTGRGDIELDFPSGDVFVVEAWSKSGGLVDVGNAESSGCSVTEQSDSRKTIACNGATAGADPVYAVTADDDDGAQLSHDIVLSF